MQVWLAESGHATQLNGLVPSHTSQAQKWGTNSWKEFTGVKPTDESRVDFCIKSMKDQVYRRNRRNCKEWQWISHSKLDNCKQYALMLIKEVKRIRRRFATCWSKLMNNSTVQLLIDAELSYFLKKQNKLKLFKQYSILRMRKDNIFCIEVRFVRSISYLFFRPWIFSAHLTRGRKGQANTSLRVWLQFSSPLSRR